MSVKSIDYRSNYIRIQIDNELYEDKFENYNADTGVPLPPLPSQAILVHADGEDRVYSTDGSGEIKDFLWTTLPQTYARLGQLIFRKTGRLNSAIEADPIGNATKQINELLGGSTGVVKLADVLVELATALTAENIPKLKQLAEQITLIYTETGAGEIGPGDPP